MDNLDYLSSEYAVIHRSGEVHFELAGKTFCLINTSVMMLREGAIIFNGSEDELRASDDPYIKRFIRGK